MRESSPTTAEPPELASARFLQMAAHDLHDPLRVVRGYLDLLLAHEPPLDATARAHVEAAQETVERMMRLLDAMREFAIVGSAPLQREPVDLSRVLADALDSLQLRIKESGARVALDPLPTVPGDATLLTQLFQNLVANAIKFHGGRPPRVHVTSQVDGGRVLVRVRDEGVGFPPGFISHAFDAFRRGHGDAYPGTGLGLAICRRIVERHGGAICIEGNPDGPGATLLVEFPLEPFPP